MLTTWSSASATRSPASTSAADNAHFIIGARLLSADYGCRLRAAFLSPLFLLTYRQKSCQKDVLEEKRNEPSQMALDGLGRDRGHRRGRLWQRQSEQRWYERHRDARCEEGQGRRDPARYCFVGSLGGRGSPAPPAGLPGRRR